jgi:23S rRNA (cytidine1920-2'-O)/16S rRNA (cytidine1409-2'-O)-methyltransferase
VRRGLASSRDQAKAAVEAGLVLVGGAPAQKASRMVGPSEPVRFLGPPPRFVSRGGEKLDAALSAFGIDPAGRRALDVGSSTGGFTDCLLQRGATEVVAVDVGRNQLHERLRADPRVLSLERTDIRSFAGSAHETFDLVVADLSFISVRAVAQVLADLASDGADLVVLVKPEFEAGRKVVSRGRGVVRDPEVWRDVLMSVASALSDAGAAMIATMVSPLTGGDGNVEFLTHCKVRDESEPSGGETARERVSRLVDGVVAEASRRHLGQD